MKIKNILILIIVLVLIGSIVGFYFFAIYPASISYRAICTEEGLQLLEEKGFSVGSFFDPLENEIRVLCCSDNA